MKKLVLKIVIWVLTFVLAFWISGRVLNKESQNLTMDMPVATLPVITIERAGILYNQLHGYLSEMDVAYQRECITEIGESREIAFLIQTYGDKVDSVFLEVRSMNGERLIENTEIPDLEMIEGKIRVRSTIKDLIEKDQEYMLVIRLQDAQGRNIRYYTRLIWSDRTNELEKIRFVQDFHEKLFQKEHAKELTRYLESNSKGDNTTLHKVNIHSSLSQVTFGDLPVEQEGNPVVTVRELDPQTATIQVESLLSAEGEIRKDYFQVSEIYRIRYTKDRVYLLNYDRTMTQLPTMEKSSFQGDKIRLGIVQEDIPLTESADGNQVAYVVGGNLYGYNYSSNHAAVIFSFAEDGKKGEKLQYRNYDIKVLHITEDGDILFAVYGYMNRGLHEGEVGVSICDYHQNRNTVEELLFIETDRSAEILRQDLSKLLYYGEDESCYLYMNHGIFQVRIKEKAVQEIARMEGDEGLEISENHRVVTWTEGKILHILTLDDARHSQIQATPGEKLQPLGFMGEDVIYGAYWEKDVYQDKAGRLTRPMYQLCICEADGSLLKTYSQNNVYVLGCTVEDNQIILSQVKKLENGAYEETVPEQIMSSEMAKGNKNTISVVAIAVYERFVQVKLKGEVNSKAVQIMTPRLVVFEENRRLSWKDPEEDEQLYVYAGGGLQAVYQTPALAMKLAYDLSGVVTDRTGERIWIKGNRVTKNQIMAIKERRCKEGETSLSVCLDTMLELEGVTRNTPELLEQGKTAFSILEEGLKDYRILDLEGCPLDAILYYVNRDIPVMANLNNGEAVLVVGFNEFNVVIFEPSTGRLYKKGMNDSKEWFEQNGNRFLTYNRPALRS